jgi:electron transport complex protein RnfB
MKDIYKKLARHLDKMPAGFPSTDTGVELRILKRLFTPQEAEIATRLFLKPEPASIIAERAGLDADELSPVLEAMSKKGLILRSGKGKELLFMAAQFMIGIWEYHVNDLDEGLIRDFDALRLILKEKPKQWVPPRNLVETYMTIAQERIKQVS